MLSIIMWIAVILLCAASYPSNGARILGVLGTGSKSRYANMRNLAEEMVSRGHEVLLIVPSTVLLPPSKRVKHSPYQSSFEKYLKEKNVVPKCHSGSRLEAFQRRLMWMDVFINDCRLILQHVKQDEQELKQFDLLFGDSPPHCNVIVAELLGLPLIDIQPAYVMRLKLDISLVSYIPSMLSFNGREMSFMERVTNLLFFAFEGVTRSLMGSGLGKLKTEFNVMPERHFKVSRNMAEMTLIMGHFALEYPQPVLPDTKLVGPLTVKPPSPLPQDLEQFIRGAGDKGIILFSLGTLGDAVLQKHQVDMLAKVFGRLEQRIIWRLNRHVPEDLSSNIKVLPWIPQNDLLAHNSTRAFISHTGHNSLYEAAFYGVPLVCIPIFGDQPSNCIQAKTVGMAIGPIDIKTVTGDEMYHAIRRILNEPSFKSNGTRVSRLLRDNPRTFVQEAADWIEYVHRHKGAKHLKSQVYNLYWYQYYLLDLLVFLLTAIFAFCFAIRMLFRLLWKIVTRNGKGDKTSKQE